MTREEAIKDIQDNIKPVVGGISLDMAIKALEAEPTKEERRLLEKWRDNRGVSMKDFEEAMNELEAEPCEDAISRQALFRALEKSCEFNAEVNAVILAQPSVTPARPKGKWIEDDEHNQNHVEKIWHCSECNYEAWGEYDKSDFCGGCGADMREEENNG